MNRIAPCKDCAERFTACHDRCPKDERGEFGYKAWVKLQFASKRDASKNRFFGGWHPSTERLYRREGRRCAYAKRYRGGVL